MIVFDQLKKEDAQLRVVTLVVLLGLLVLIGGLWWVQVVSTADYQANLETQSFRSVRIPAVRGKILDRNGHVLAENQPSYNLCLYLDELRRDFETAGNREVSKARADLKRAMEAQEKKLGRTLTRNEKTEFTLSLNQKEALQQKARYEVASNVVARVGNVLQQRLTLNSTNFERHYKGQLVLPLTIMENLDATQIARFEEQRGLGPENDDLEETVLGHSESGTDESRLRSRALRSSGGLVGVDIEMKSSRVYPFGVTAAHLLGHLHYDDSSQEGEESFFTYRLPDFRGIVGIEAACDKELRGMAGAKSVQINSRGYRTTENVWSSAEAGQNVTLTIDVRLQQAAEAALKNARVAYLPPVRGAVVVMDVNTGDILAMASSPTLDPNLFVKGGVSPEEWKKITAFQTEKNRATQEHYPPASVFKTVVGLAALEAGLNKTETVRVPREKCIYVHGHPFRDTVEPGDYDFNRALSKSSNTYFVTMGLRYGAERIVRLAQRLHFGERTGLGTRQEAAGHCPDLRRVQSRSEWNDISTGNMSIGQDPILVTPLQVAVLTSALANGGKVLFPRVVERIEPMDPASEQQPVVCPGRRVRDELGVSPASMTSLHEAMLHETDDLDGSGYPIKTYVPTLRVCGKTGTAQMQDVHGKTIGHTTWFASFAPYDNPRYAVVVMVEDGESGKTSCVPAAGKVYKAILERDAARTSLTRLRQGDGGQAELTDRGGG